MKILIRVISCHIIVDYNLNMPEKVELKDSY